MNAVVEKLGDTVPARRQAGGGEGAASLHDAVLTRLRDYIVEGHLPDGARVPERQLCEMFGVSRTPLREALKVLSAEGLVDLLPNRGARIRPVSRQDLRNLFDVMGGLEALAGRLACERITPEAFEEVEFLHHKMYGFYLRQDLPEYFKCNQAIHQKIVDIAGNAVLTATYAGFADRLRRFRYAANLNRKSNRWSEAMREHEAILDALRRRAGGELGDLLFQHIRQKYEAASEGK